MSLIKSNKDDVSTAVSVVGQVLNYKKDCLKNSLQHYI